MLAVALAALLPAGAHASVGGILKPAAVPCYKQAAAPPCGALPDLTTNPNYVQGLAISPDGSSVYEAETTGIAEFHRTGTGALTDVGLAPLASADRVVVARDGSAVYASDASTLYSFSRNTTTGALTANGCLRVGGGGGCTNLSQAAGGALAVNHSQVFTYSSAGIIDIFALHAGAAPTYFDCVDHTLPPAASPCASHSAPLTGGGGPKDLAFDATEQLLYAATEASDSVVVMHANGNGPEWTPLDPASGGCVNSTGAGGCVTVAYAGAPRAIAVTSNRVIVASPLGSSLYILGRNASGLLSAIPGGCAAGTPSVTCPGGLTNSNFIYGVGVDPAGANAYFTAQNNGYLGVLDIGGGVIAEKTAPFGCLVEGTAFPTCTENQPALNGPSYAKVTPDGKSVYVDAISGLSVYQRLPAPTCSPAARATTAGTPLSFNVSCTGNPGDSLSIGLVSGPAHGTLSLGHNGAAIYIPAAGFTGIDRFSFGATAPGERSDPAPAVILVNPKPSPPKRITAQVTFFISAKSGRFISFSVSPIPSGGKVQLRCKGKGCPFKKKSVAVRHGRANALKLFKRKKLRRGMVIDVYVTARGRIGEVKRIKVATQTKVTRTLCIPVGHTRPQRTC